MLFGIGPGGWVVLRRWFVSFLVVWALGLVILLLFYGLFTCCLLVCVVVAVYFCGCFL